MSGLNQVYALMGIKGVTDVGGDPAYAGYLIRLDNSGNLPLTVSPGGGVVFTDHYYVDGTLGDDVTGDGSIANPFETLQQVRDELAGSGNANAVIHLAPGSYAAPTAFPGTVDYLEIYGSSPDQVDITGTITFVAAQEVYVRGVTVNTITDQDIAGTFNVYVDSWSDITSVTSANVGVVGTVTVMPGSSVGGVVNLNLVALPLATSLGYTPLVPADWDGPPAVVSAALDEAADRVRILETANLVSGPGVAVTDQRIAVWDGASGQLLEESTFLVSAILTGAANVGAGVGLFRDVTAQTANFRTLTSPLGTLNLVINADVIELDVDEANLDLANLGGTLTVPQGGTGATTLDGLVVGNGAAAMTAIKINYGAVIDPTAFDDDTLGYAVGSRWINTLTGEEFVCMDDTTNLAVWESTTGGDVGEDNTASNVGAGQQVFKQKTGVDLEFRTLIGGTNVSISQNANDLTISATFAGSEERIKLDVTQAAHGFAIGDVIRHNGAAYVTAQADTLSNCEGAVGIVESVPDGANFTVVFAGRITLSGLTPGSVHYISDVTPGDLVTTAPTIAKPALVGVTATEGVVINQRALGDSVFRIRAVEQFTLAPGDITNEYVDLAKEPVVPADVVVIVKSGPGQFYGDDYEMDGVILNRLKWTGLGLAGALIAGDKLTVIYDYYI
jgi:hypothetical protein